MKRGKKSQSVYICSNITLYLYSYLEFAQFVVLKYFQILKNNYIINLQMTRILKKNTLSKVNHLKKAIYVCVFPHSSWLEQFSKCYSIIASSAIISKNHLFHVNLSWVKRST